MTATGRLLETLQQEDLNFLLTNRIPRRTISRFVRWFSRIEQPLVRDVSIAVWRFFSGLDLSEATSDRFRSMHECFTRRLRPGARPIDPRPDILVSPCDAIVGAHGSIRGTELYQIKGRSYTLAELLRDDNLVESHRDGRYVTLRLTSAMYHRFHAPYDCRIDLVSHIAGDRWNVNPAALRRVDKLYCKNERVVLRARLAPTDETLLLVPIGAILVAGIRLNFITPDELKHPRPDRLGCDAQFRKGDEMGWFEHGSTILVIAQGSSLLCDNVREGAIIRVGEPLLRLPDSGPARP
jgi:phosphatidylserine decarboxylase